MVEVIGYKAKIDNYTFLRFPSRCTKIELFDDGGTEEEASRTYTQNIKKVEVPGTVKYISDYAFGDPHEHSTFSKCEEIILNNGITSLGEAFRENKSLKKINIPKSVTTLGNGTFFGCVRITKITLPNSITSIGNSAFAGTGITEIAVPKSVETIGENAFCGCSNLRKAFIPKEVITINSDFGWEPIFYGCASNFQIYTDASQDNPGWERNWNSNYTVHYNTTLEQFNALD